MKNKIIQSTILLIIFSVIAKALSFFVRIYLARTLSADAMNIYSLASPTLVFIITIAQMGIPAALSKVIAQSKSSASALLTSIILSLVNNIIVITLFMLLIPFLAQIILKDAQIIPVMKAMLPMIPMVTLSGLLKGYLQGKQEHVSACASQMFEEIFRIIYLLISFTNAPVMTPVRMAEIAMLSVFVGECGSSLYMFIFCMIKRTAAFPVNELILKLNRASFDEILRVSIPMTSSRLIGSLTFFLEPMLMVLSVSNASSIVATYGQLNGYVLPILTMPSFITVTLANTLLPSFTYETSHGNRKRGMKIFNVIFWICLLIGFSCSAISFFFTDQCLNLFYHNTLGSVYLKSLAWPFAFYALQPVLSSMLHAFGQSKKAMIDTLSGSVIRLLIITFLTPVLNEAALPLALTASMLITTFMHAVRVSFYLWKEPSSA
ncbi:oligosaccharide flippase family protein [Dielma fastidiosa]|uniref:oligosaccharide flippase family protein n=1 Tax=Dielma fastidiosa TaxID=1034346 RepID=UPI003FED9201